MYDPEESPCQDFNLIIAGHDTAFKGFHTWRTRGTRSWVLIYTLAGVARFGHPAGEIHSEPGEMTLLAPGTLHDYGVAPSAPHWERVWAHFYPYSHWQEWLSWPEAAPGLMRLKLEDPKIRSQAVEKFMEAYRLSVGPSRRRDALAMNAFEGVLIRCDMQNPRSAEAQWDERVRQAVGYLSEQFAEPFSLEKLAEAAGLSVSRIAHLFRQQTGVTPQQFHEGQRVERARRLLEFTSRRVEAIAYEVGYDDPFYFSKRFKVRTGLSPRDYRKQSRLE
jgi:AraC family transcriptional regulator, arabinose operon regulatory protein